MIDQLAVGQGFIFYVILETRPLHSILNYQEIYCSKTQKSKTQNRLR